MADSVKPRRSFPGPINKFEWVGVAVVLIPALATLGNLSWINSTAVGVPLALFSLFIPLAAGYVCKFTPLDRSVLWRTLLTHVMAAQVLSFLWTLVAGPFARALSYIPQFRGLDKQFSSDLWIVYVTGSLVYLMSIAFQYVVIAQKAAKAVELRAVETSMLARDAELRALRAQINPHFLFNSLNSISALTSIDPARAREMCLLLADFLRLTLGMGEKHVIRFSEELDLLEKFMAIEKVRFGERLHMEENIHEAAKRCQIPALLLQPLLENAVSHGIASMADGGWIRLQAEVQDGRLGIMVENDRDDEAPPRRKNGVGLKNVRSRLEARYGKDATFRIEASEDRFRVSMTLPAEYGETT
ncbi:MAG TPA: histidine kinase [Candidatus Eisenbacteria bacterium]|jgi:two-component sensor histidine kinase|nr:histidine kinase [Candidatus Eisenbacteria bacterium]